MMYPIRVLIVVEEEELIPLLQQPLEDEIRRAGLTPNVEVVSSLQVMGAGMGGPKSISSMDYGLLRFFKDPPDWLVIGTDLIGWIRKMRNVQPHIPIELVPNRAHRDLKNDIIEWAQQDADHPLSILNEPDVVWTRLDEWPQRTKEIVNRLRTPNPLWRLAPEQSALIWELSGYEQAIDAVSVYPPAVDLVRNRLLELRDRFPGQTVLASIGGGKGSGKSTFERDWRNHIRRVAEDAIATGKVNPSLAARYRELEKGNQSMVVKISTTKQRGDNEPINTRDWRKAITAGATEFMMTINREGYRNALRTTFIMDCLEEFEVVNNMALQSGLRDPSEPALPALVFLRFPGTQKLRRDLFPRTHFANTFKAFLILTSIKVADWSVTTEQTERLYERGRGEIEAMGSADLRKLREHVVHENLRGPYETFWPRIYDGVLLNERGYERVDRVKEILRNLIPRPSDT